MQIDQKHVLRSIKTGKPFEILFYENNQNVNQFIHSIIIELSNKYDIEKFSDVIYSCIRELVMNAIKANLKRVYFHKHNIDINDIGQYITGLVQFRAILSNHEYKTYHTDLQDMNLWVKFAVEHDADGICFEVKNNTAIADLEERRIRLKLQKSMLYDQIIDLYNQEEKNPEGAGLGTAMIVLLMEKANLDASLFRIGTVNGITVSRIEVPITSNYKPKRPRQYKKQRRQLVH
jgi:hypothetical protein